MEKLTILRERLLKIGIEVEYIEIADPKTLLSDDTDLNQMVICFAGFLEGVRLIDNIVVDL